jgi:hypothetical protein
MKKFNYLLVFVLLLSGCGDMKMDRKVHQKTRLTISNTNIVYKL